MTAAHAGPTHALSLQIEMAGVASTNAALDPGHARADGAAELVVGLPYVLRSETREVRIGSRASARQHTDDSLDRSRDLGLDVAWVERLRSTTVSTRARASQRALDVRLDPGASALDARRTRIETGGSVQLSHALARTGTLQATLSAARVRHEQARGDDALTDYSLASLNLRYQRALAAGAREGDPAQALSLDVSATRHAPDDGLPRTRTIGAAAGWRWRTSEQLSMEAHAGIDVRQLESDGNDGLGGGRDVTPAFGASVQYDAEYHSIALDLSRALQPSAVGTLTRNTSLTIDARYRVTPTRHLYVTTAWSRVDALDGNEGTRLAGRLRNAEGDTFSARGGMHWQGTPELAFDVSYAWAHVDRGEGAQGRSAAQDHALQLAVAYTPRGWRW